MLVASMFKKIKYLIAGAAMQVNERNDGVSTNH